MEEKVVIYGDVIIENLYKDESLISLVGDAIYQIRIPTGKEKVRPIIVIKEIYSHDKVRYDGYVGFQLKGFTVEVLSKDYEKTLLISNKVKACFRKLGFEQVSVTNSKDLDIYDDSSGDYKDFKIYNGMVEVEYIK